MSLNPGWDKVGLARPDRVREDAFVGGQWVTGSACMAVTDPATGADLGSVPDLDGVATEEAVAAATAASNSRVSAAGIALRHRRISEHEAGLHGGRGGLTPPATNSGLEGWQGVA